MRRVLVWISCLLVLIIALTGWKESHRLKPVALTPSLTGQNEYCLTCHSDLTQISASHPIQVFGCVYCHGGERLALSANLAHSTLRGGNNPSDFTVVEASCGGEQCHSGSPESGRDHIQRVLTNLHSTYAGAIAAVRYMIGAQPDRKAIQGLGAIQDNQVTTSTGLSSLAAFNPAQQDLPLLQTFANNCLDCHLSARLANAQAGNKFTGCAACHAMLSGNDSSLLVHRLDTAIAYNQCNSCHNRGNYTLQPLTFLPRNDPLVNRQQEYYLPGTQFTKCEVRLDCVDCHTRQEIMGDGDIHSNQAEVLFIQCRTCHGTLTELPLTRTITKPDELVLRLAALNPAVHLQVGDAVIVTSIGEPLWNTRMLENGTYELVGKVTGQHFTFQPVMGSGCRQNLDQQESQYCHACHTIQH